MNNTNIANKLIGCGLSIIPIKMPGKQPRVAWKQFQKRLPEIGELNYSNAIALICGDVSGGVEVVDIDTKNYHGDGNHLIKRLKRAIRKRSPKLLTKLIEQRTLSGGIHLIYRCKVIEGNQILVADQNGKPIIETRGEGGYVAIAPTPGYSFKHGSLEKINTITPKERKTLFEACRSLEKLSEPHHEFQKEKAAGQNTLEELEKLNKYIDALGKKDITKSYEHWRNVLFGISHSLGEAGRNAMHKLCRNYTNYSQEECNTKFDDCLKSKRIKKPVTIATVYDLICNALSDSKKKHLAMEYSKESKLNTEDPVLFDEKTGWRFNKDDVIAKWMKGKGFRHLKNDQGFSWIFIDENNQCEILQAKHAASFFNELLLKEFPDATALVNSNKVIKFEVSALIPQIKDFHRDSPNQKFIYFKNCVVECNKRGHCIIPWNKISLPVWKKNVKERIFSEPAQRWKMECLFGDLIKNLQNPKIQTPDYFMRVIGYSVHNYKRADDDQIVVIMANQKVKHSDNKGAGSGKTLLGKSFQHISNQVFIPGDTIDFKDRFAFQNIDPDTENILIDDYTGKLTYLKTVATGDMKVEKKHQDSFTIPKEKVPKIIITLPEVPDITDEGIRRRLYPIVISDYYYDMLQKGDQSPIVSVHGKRFFEEFNDDDWNGYYRFIIECCILYLKKRPDPKPVLKILFDRLAHQTFEDDELVKEIKGLPINRIILIDNFFEKFKQDQQTFLAFSKVFRKILRTLNYKSSDHRVGIAREGEQPKGFKADDREWSIAKKGKQEKWATGIKIIEKQPIY